MPDASPVVRPVDEVGSGVPVSVRERGFLLTVSRSKTGLSTRVGSSSFVTPSLPDVYYDKRADL
jgi:hypothetical protein